MKNRPVYIQLRDAIAEAILEGRYSDGDALPSVRALASEHHANPLTVAKAYQTFHDDALIVTRRGVGIFLADGASARFKEMAKHRFLNVEWPQIRSQMKRLEIDIRTLMETNDV